MYAVTAERTVSAMVLLSAPLSAVVANVTPRLSDAVTVKAKIESGLVERTTVTLGDVRSSVLLSTVAISLAAGGEGDGEHQREPVQRTRDQRRLCAD